MATVSTTPWNDYVGSRLRLMREDRRFTQEQVAGWVRQLWGLPWTRATVTALEAGRRELNALELIALTDVFRLSPSDLLSYATSEPRSVQLRVSATSSVSLQVVVRALAGKSPTIEGRDTPWIHSAANQVTSLPDVRARLEAQGVEPTNDALAWVLQGERSDAERMFANRHGFNPRDLAVAAVKLWGQSLTAERDARFERSVPEPTSDPSARTTKGHITRGLLDELVELIGGN